MPNAGPTPSGADSSIADAPGAAGSSRVAWLGLFGVHAWPTAGTWAESTVLRVPGEAVSWGPGRLGWGLPPCSCQPGASRLAPSFPLPPTFTSGEPPGELASWLTLCPPSGVTWTPCGAVLADPGPGTAEGLLGAEPQLGPARSVPAGAAGPQTAPEGQTRSGQRRAWPPATAKLAGGRRAARPRKEPSNAPHARPRRRSRQLWQALGATQARHGECSELPQLPVRAALLSGPARGAGCQLPGSGQRVCGAATLQRRPGL